MSDIELLRALWQQFESRIIQSVVKNPREDKISCIKSVGELGSYGLLIGTLDINKQFLLIEEEESYKCSLTFREGSSGFYLIADSSSGDS